MSDGHIFESVYYLNNTDLSEAGSDPAFRAALAHVINYLEYDEGNDYSCHEDNVIVRNDGGVGEMELDLDEVRQRLLAGARIIARQSEA